MTEHPREGTRVVAADASSIHTAAALIKSFFMGKTSLSRSWAACAVHATRMGGGR